jgi:hypothetical protein
MKNPIGRLPLPAACAGSLSAACTGSLLAACAALALFIAGATAGPAMAAAIHFEHESYQQFQSQLGRGEVHAVVLHAKQHIAHISLADGRHMTAVYPANEQARIIDEAHAKGTAAVVAVSTHKAAAVHHKLRYIAGGVLIVVILVVLVVLLIGRRRELVEADEPTAG